MKKIFAIFLAMIMVFSLAACGSSDEAETEAETAEETEAVETEEETEEEEEDEDDASEPEYVSVFDLDDISAYIVLGEYEGMTVSYIDTTVTDEDLEDAIDAVFDELGTQYVEITEGTVEEGDVVNIDYVGYIDGVAFDGGSYEGYDLTIGSGQFIDGFEDGLIDVAIGDTVDLELTFPDDYAVESLAGVDVVFTVTVNYVQGDAITWVLNDSFVVDYTDGELETVDEFYEYLIEELEEEMLAEAEETQFDEAWEQIRAGCEFPESCTELEEYITAYEIYELVSTMELYGLTLDDYYELAETTEDEFNELLQEYAETYSQNMLMLRAIIEAEDLIMTDAEYDAYLEAMAESVESDVDTLLEYYSEGYLKDVIYQQIVMSVVLAAAVVEE